MSVFGPSIKHTVELSGKTEDNEMILQGRMLSLTSPLGLSSPRSSKPNFESKIQKSR